MAEYKKKQIGLNLYTNRVVAERFVHCALIDMLHPRGCASVTPYLVCIKGHADPTSLHASPCSLDSTLGVGFGGSGPVPVCVGFAVVLVGGWKLGTATQTA